MSYRLKQRKIKQKIYSWWMVAILAVVAFFFVSNTLDVYKKYSDSKQTISSLEDRYEKTNSREVELQEKIENLQSESGLEEEIRDKFNVAKEGEEVVIIVDSKESEVQIDIEEEGLFEGFWNDILNIFK